MFTEIIHKIDRAKHVILFTKRSDANEECLWDMVAMGSIDGNKIGYLEESDDEGRFNNYF
jgi:hypothetical protein